MNNQKSENRGTAHNSSEAIVREARFKVPGAGELIIEAEPGIVCHTGGAAGIGIGCTWGRYGEVGGIMDKSEVERLVEYLQNWLA